MTLTLEQEFRQEQWCRWLMTYGRCDFETATSLARRLIKRTAKWGDLDPAGDDPCKESR